MMEPTKYKERTKIEDNFNDPRVIYQKEEDDIGFSRLRVIRLFYGRSLLRYV